MRSEKEMFELILSFAENHQIQAVYMNGSRANPNAKKDILQDFDIVYVTNNVKKYITNKSWLTYFGDIAVMQEPDEPKWDNDKVLSYAYLVQFKDGNRIDFTFVDSTIAKEHFLTDKMVITLLDKENILPVVKTTDAEYHIMKPSEEEYQKTVNEFWWVSLYIAKGLARNEPLYAIGILNDYVRPKLIKMLNWQVGINTNFSLGTGKYSKNIKNYLDATTYEHLVMTYPALEIKAIWQSLDTMTTLFSKVAHDISKIFAYVYDEKQEHNALKHIEWLKNIQI